MKPVTKKELKKNAKILNVRSVRTVEEVNRLERKGWRLVCVSIQGDGFAFCMGWEGTLLEVLRRKMRRSTKRAK